MNLVVVARRPEIGEHCAAIISQLTGRHPSRTLICSPADPDGPGWLDARITAHCMLPREDAPETCAETIYVTAGGETGPAHRRDRRAAPGPRPAGHRLVARRAAARLAPGERPARGRRPARDRRLELDRRRPRPAARAGAAASRRGELAVFDFALVRQSRWREAIASTFDMPDFLPYLRSIRRIAVTYGTHDELGRPGRRTWSSRSITSPGSPRGWG